MSGTLAAVVVIAIGVALVAFSAVVLTGMAADPGQQPRAATDVELGPGGVTIELEAVGNADTVTIERNGNLIRKIVDPRAGIEAVIEASNVSAGDTITVVGEADGNRVVLDSLTVGANSVAAGGRSADGTGGSSGGSSGSGGGVGESDVGGGWSIGSTTDGDQNMPFDGSSDGESEPTGDSTERDDESTVATAWAVDRFDPASVSTGESGPVVAGTEAGSVVAVNRSDGTPRWSASVSDRRVSAVATSSGSVYAGTANGTLTRVDGGTVNWSVDLGTALEGGPNVTVTDVERSNGSTYTTLTSVNDTTASALVRTAPDGTVQWSRTRATGHVTALAAASEGVVVTTGTNPATGNHSVRRVEENGSTAWATALPRAPTAVESVGGQVTVALAGNESANSTVWRLADDGRVVWRHDTGAAANVTAIAGTGRRTYLALAAPADSVRALDADGTRLWRHRLSADDGSRAVDGLRVGPDGALYVGGSRLTRLSVGG